MGDEKDEPKKVKWGPHMAGPPPTDSPWHPDHPENPKNKKPAGQ